MGFPCSIGSVAGPSQFSRLMIDHTQLRTAAQNRPSATESPVPGVMVNNHNSLFNAIDSGAPLIRFQNGNYSSLGHGDYSTASGGTIGNPVIIIPETPNGVTFSGNTSFRFGGSDIEFSGFKFSDNNPLGSINNNITVYWNVLRGVFLANEFTRAGINAPSNPSAIWIGPGAHDAEIAGNTFIDTHGRDMTGDVSCMNVHIHHNGRSGMTWARANPTFYPGQEHIAFGTFGTMTQNALIEYNECQAGGDYESISIKNNGNTIRYNYVFGNDAVNRDAISISDGSNNVMYGNYSKNVGQGAITYGRNNKWYYNFSDCNETSIRMVDRQFYAPSSVQQEVSAGCDIRQNIFIGPNDYRIFSTSNDLYEASTEKPNGNVIDKNFITGSSAYGRYEGGGQGGPYTESQFNAANTVQSNLRPSIAELTATIPGYSLPFYWLLTSNPYDVLVVDNVEYLPS